MLLAYVQIYEDKSEQSNAIRDVILTRVLHTHILLVQPVTTDAWEVYTEAALLLWEELYVCTTTNYVKTI